VETGPHAWRVHERQEVTRMRLSTSRFGWVEIDEQDVFAVPHGIPGFPELRRVALFRADGGKDDATLFWLQDLDDGHLAFLCLVPWTAFPDYDIEFDEASLGIEDSGDVRVLNLVTVRREESDVEVSGMTVNLRAPLIVDVFNRSVQQIILTDTRWSVYTPLVRPTERVG
jgi:flagellar assembly factor FliW